MIDTPNDQSLDQEINTKTSSLQGKFHHTNKVVNKPKSTSVVHTEKAAKSTSKVNILPIRSAAAATALHQNIPVELLDSVISAT